MSSRRQILSFSELLDSSRTTVSRTAQNKTGHVNITPFMAWLSPSSSTRCTHFTTCNCTAAGWHLPHSGLSRSATAEMLLPAWLQNWRAQWVEYYFSQAIGRDKTKAWIKDRLGWFCTWSFAWTLLGGQNSFHDILPQLMQNSQWQMQHPKCCKM